MKRKKQVRGRGFNPFDFELFKQPKISKIIEAKVRQDESIIYGARAMNRQIAGLVSRPTEDYDIYTNQPRKTALFIEKKLDREVALGRNDYYVKPAIHGGTWKVMYVGYDKKKGTPDDKGIVDYTKPTTKIKVVRLNGISYEALSNIVKVKKAILKDKESKYRWEKDRNDLIRIKFAKQNNLALKE